MPHKILKGRRFFLLVLALSALTIVSSVPAVAQTCSTPSFSQPPIYPVDNDVRSLAAADFDADGRPDLAVANSDSNNVLVITKVSTAQAQSTNYPVGSFPISIAAADFNGDGRLDLVTANNSSANVSLLINNGAGSFAAASAFASDPGPRSVVAGDFNRDGNVDIAVASNFSISVLLGNGQGSLGSPINTQGGTNNLVAADFNNDSKLDLFAGDTSTRLLLGDGTGHFTTGCGGGSGGNGIAVGDLNSDGKLDLVTSNVLSAKIEAVLGDGTGCVNSPFTIDVLDEGRPRAVALADLNNDGKLDIIGGTTVMLGNGTGSFGAPIFYGSGSIAEPGSNTVVADFDKDGKIDIATAGRGTVGVLLGDGLGGFKLSFGPVGMGAYEVDQGDLNSDGKLDLIVSQFGRVTRMLGDGSGGFGAPVTFPDHLSAGFGLVSGDYNRDGKLDVMVLDESNNGPQGLPRLHLLLGNGAGGFSQVISTSFTDHQPADLVAGDFNNDGNLDALTINRLFGGGSISILQGDGTGHFGAPSNFPLPSIASNPRGVAIADFNTDGKADLAIAASFGFSILPGNGAGGFGPATHITTVGATSLRTADLNGDGKFDLAIVAEQQEGKLSIVLGNGNGTFGPPTQHTVGYFPSDLVLADFNGDNKIDIATSNARQVDSSFRSGVSVLFGNGTGNFGPASHFAADRSPDRIITGDFNRDGRPDLVTANQPSNNLSLFLNACTGPVGGSVQLTSLGYSATEADGNVKVIVNRTGTSGSATVNYTTSDNAGLNECNLINGIGSSRCDYATSIGILRFAAGESSKTIFIPVVDDRYAEGNETFKIALSNPVGAAFGSITSATITIQDNETVNGVNPIDGVDFFIRQQYIDFLGREPDPIGMTGWRNVLNNCPPSGKDANGNFCDRIEVSAGFFRSEEFQSRGYYIYRFYSAMGQIPVSQEFFPDFAKVSGFLSAEQLEANKAAYVNEVMARPDFQTKYGATLNNPTAFVDALLQTVGLPNHPTRQHWIDQLTALNNAQTRAQVLRGLVESSEVFNKYFNQAFVIMQYFGYLRRTADASYLDWINTMNQTGGDYRIMINGFMNSAEYRRRFGP